MPGFDHFSFIAPIYDRAIHFQRAQEIIDILDLPVEGPLLDAGGGTGRVAQALYGLGKPIVVADVSMGMLRQALEKDGIRIVCAPTEKLPFPDGSFERVVMVDALHHVYSQLETARELWRVLKPGGRLVIEEPDVRTFGVKWIALGEKLLCMRSHFLKPAEIAGLFSESNASTQIRVNGTTAWVIVNKSAH